MKSAKALIDEGRLYRKLPILRRLVPSVRKRIERFLWPEGRPILRHPVRLLGVSAPAIHIFGDSHVGLWEQTPTAIPHYLGPVTMHRVGRDGVRTFGLDGVKINHGEAMGFIFGEIDVRVHVARQRDRFRRQPNEIIETLATAYLSALQDVQRARLASEVIVFSIIPPAGKSYPFLNREMPRNGTDKDRVAWTLQLNDTLRKSALQAGCGFIDQYTPFANGRGLLDRRFTKDGTHVTPLRPIEVTCQFA